jgi:AraC-like DNA-binding protein
MLEPAFSLLRRRYDIICERAIGLDGSFRLPMAIWRWAPGVEHEFPESEAAVLSIFRRGASFEMLRGPRAGVTGGTTPSSYTLASGLRRRAYRARAASAVTQFYLQRTDIQEFCEREALPQVIEMEMFDRYFEVDGELHRLLSAYSFKMLEMADAMFKAEADAWTILVYSRLLRVIGVTTGHAGTAKWTARLTARQEYQVVDYIEAHLGENIAISEIAGLLEYSESYLSRAFKNSFNMAPHQYIMDRRINRAKQLMLSGMPLAQVASQCGFASPQHFSFAFRNLVGCPPSRWRRAADGHAGAARETDEGSGDR